MLKYKKYSQNAIEELQEKQNLFIKKYDTANFDNWFYNQSSEILKLYSKNKEIYFKYIPIGTFSMNTNTWLWSWANTNSIEPRKFKTLKIKEFGEKKSYKNLINEYFKGDNFTGWELTAIAFGILNGIGTYRVVSKHLEIYFLITEQVSKEKANEIESKLIECNIHGKIRKAFICQHLNTEYKTGFEEAFDTYKGMELNEGDDFQAWCDNCEKERIKTNGWNDKSMELAKIKLVCERCYFDIKVFNLPE